MTITRCCSRRPRPSPRTPILHDKLPYDVADLVPIARVSNTMVAIVAPAAMKVGSLAELFAQARERPGKLNWATATGISDFLMASFLKNANLDMSKVPYRDTVQASTDLAEGRIQFYWGALAIVRPQVQAGKARLIAFSNTTRAPRRAERSRPSPRPAFPR